MLVSLEQAKMTLGGQWQNQKMALKYPYPPLFFYYREGVLCKNVSGPWELRRLYAIVGCGRLLLRGVVCISILEMAGVFCQMRKLPGSWAWTVR